MRPRTAQRLRAVEHSATLTTAELVEDLLARGETVFDLSSGDPDFPSPAHVIAATEQSMRAGFTHYVPSRGIRPLLDQVARSLRATSGLDYDADTEIVITSSAKHALYITLLSILDPDDEVLILTPSWVSYDAMVRLVGGIPVAVPLAEAENFRVRADDLRPRLTPRTRAVILNSPNNPTGRVLSVDELACIVHVACQHDLLIVADEVYNRILYDGCPAVSVGTLAGARERTVTINGFSKTYAMTGWRLGYLAGPADIVGEILKTQHHTVGCAASFVQAGGVSALEGPQAAVEQMVQEYGSRRRLVVDGLNSLPGVRCRDPQGAFYAFPSIEGTGFSNSAEFTHWLLETARVAVAPGSAFGPGGEGHVRLSFATSREVLSAALEGMRVALQGRVDRT